MQLNPFVRFWYRISGPFRRDPGLEDMARAISDMSAIMGAAFRTKSLDEKAQNLSELARWSLDQSHQICFRLQRAGLWDLPESDDEIEWARGIRASARSVLAECARYATLPRA